VHHSEQRMRDGSAPPDPATRARKLIQELRRRHPVSDGFAAERRTALESISSEFAGTERDRLLAVVETSRERQARVQEMSRESHRALDAVTSGLNRQAETRRWLAEARERLQPWAEALAAAAPSRCRLLH
jgi:hypothetical protein